LRVGQIIFDRDRRIVDDAFDPAEFGVCDGSVLYKNKIANLKAFGASYRYQSSAGTYRAGYVRAATRASSANVSL